MEAHAYTGVGSRVSNGLVEAGAKVAHCGDAHGAGHGRTKASNYTSKNLF